MKEKGDALEDYVEEVYSMLLNIKDEGISVSRNLHLETSDGAKHEFDLFYEFQKANITHRVAIECKNWERPIPKGQVRDFQAKINDLENIQGVIVSKSGYQSGAEKYAENKEILLLQKKDLPGLPERLAKRLKAVALPDESAVGQPFWTIVELKDGKNTGSFYRYPFNENEDPSMVLFFSKKHAEIHLEESKKNPENFGVRGLEQHHLRTFLIIAHAYKQEIILFFRRKQMPRDETIANKMPLKEIEDDYYYNGEIQYMDQQLDYDEMLSNY